MLTPKYRFYIFGGEPAKEVEAKDENRASVEGKGKYIDMVH